MTEGQRFVGKFSALLSVYHDSILNPDVLGDFQRLREEFEKALITLADENTAWRNMVAVLCADGGHFHADHGTLLTVKKILDEWNERVCRLDKFTFLVGVLLDQGVMTKQMERSLRNLLAECGEVCNV